MGLFDKLFHRPPKRTIPAPNMTGWYPSYIQFGTDIYTSDVVQQALKCIVDEMKKLKPSHVRHTDGDTAPVRNSTLQAVLDDPNPLMTTSEFLEKVCWLLLLNSNAFIIPVYRKWTDERTGQERRYYEALYPIQPVQVDFIEDASGRLYCKFWFQNGNDTTIPYDDVIHIKYNYSVNQYMGGDASGNPSQDGIKSTLELNAQMLSGIARAMNASYAVNGIIRYNTLLDDGSMDANIKEFEKKLASSESGFLPVDLKAEITPFERKAEIVQADLAKFVDEKILRNWGVPLAILTGDFTKDQFESFYSKALEPLIISISQAITKKVFTSREKAFGNAVELYPKELVFLSMSQTLEMINILSPTGALFENEKRTALGLRPLPELEGKRYMSLNWVDANIANTYQVGQETTQPDEPTEPDEGKEADDAEA